MRECLLLYFIRDNVQVFGEIRDALQDRKVFRASGSVIDELIERLSHNNPLFNYDNGSFYSLLDD